MASENTLVCYDVEDNCEKYYKGILISYFRNILNLDI